MSIRNPNIEPRESYHGHIQISLRFAGFIDNLLVPGPWPCQVHSRQEKHAPCLHLHTCASIICIWFATNISIWNSNNDDKSATLKAFWPKHGLMRNLRFKCESLWVHRLTNTKNIRRTARRTSENCNFINSAPCPTSTLSPPNCSSSLTSISGTRRVSTICFPKGVCARNF